MKYPNVVVRVQRFLEKGVCLSAEHADGRVNSLANEAEIIALIEKRFRTRASRVRAWCDTQLYDRASRQWIPFNIKVSTGGQDNAMNRKAIVYTFTTLAEDAIPARMNDNAMVDLIKTHGRTARNPAREYYYLYVDKRDGRVLARSMCDIQNYRDNASNLLQINWGAEKRASVKFKGLTAARRLIIRTIQTSLKKARAGSQRLVEYGV